MRERNEESYNKLLFLALSQLMSLWEEKKNNFTHEAALEISVWQKKQLTTAHEAIVSCTKQPLNASSLFSLFFLLSFLAHY